MSTIDKAQISPQMSRVPVEDLISLPLENNRNIDLRSNIRGKDYKVVAVSIIPDPSESANLNAMREEALANERKAAKEKQSEAFMKKTISRVRQSKIEERIQDEQNTDIEFKQFMEERLANDLSPHCKHYSEIDSPQKDSILDKKDFPKATKETDRPTLTNISEINTKNPNSTNKTTSKVPIQVSKANTIFVQKNIKETVVEKSLKSKKIPRFVSVDDMKIQYAPTMLTKSKAPKLSHQVLEIKSKTVRDIKFDSEISDFKGMEQSRYSVALKTLVREKIKQKFSDNILTVCTCGALNHKKPLQVNTKCANNCPFYKRQQEYQKALKEILTSFKASE